MDEHQLRIMFEDFGPVFQINVLRDKITGQSKGKMSLTFCSKKLSPLGDKKIKIWIKRARLNVLRDKTTGQNKGKMSLTFCSKKLSPLGGGKKLYLKYGLNEPD